MELCNIAIKVLFVFVFFPIFAQAQVVFEDDFETDPFAASRDHPWTMILPQTFPFEWSAQYSNSPTHSLKSPLGSNTYNYNSSCWIEIEDIFTEPIALISIAVDN